MKRKTSLIVWGAVLLLAAYGIYDLVREVRRSYTSCYAHTYSHAIGQMMGPRFDSLTPRGEGIRIGVVDAGFGGRATTASRARLQGRGTTSDMTDGDTTGFFRDDCDHGTRVTRNIGGFSNDTLLGLACKADYYLVKSDLEHGEPREDERRLCRALAWARTAAGRRGQHLAGLYRIRRFRRLYAADARRPHGALLAFSRQPARCTPAHGRRTKRRQRGEKQMAPHLVPRGMSPRPSRSAPADSEGTGRSGKSGTGYYPHPSSLTWWCTTPRTARRSRRPWSRAVCRPLGYRPMKRRELIRLLHASGTRSAAARPRNGLRHPAVRHPARIPGYPR